MGRDDGVTVPRDRNQDHGRDGGGTYHGYRTTVEST